MDDVISRKAAIEAICTEGTRLERNGTVAMAEIKQWCVDILEALPSAQPEIIRCKDCKYWREHKYSKYSKRYIPFCGFNVIYTEADDFCSSAERRIDERSD